MIKIRFLVLILTSCVVLISFAWIQPCFSAFTLSVTPYEAGYDLRFGQLATQDQKVVKEFTIQVTTDIGKQYRVYQRVDRSLTTADGIEIDRNRFKMYTLINSNSKGTLERIEEFPVMSSDTVLYTSNTAGDGDSFKLVYTLEPNVNQVAGSYYGRILFILIPIDSAQDQVVETLNMYADLTSEGAVEVTTGTGSKSIRISSKDLDKVNPQYPTVFINIKGNMGTRYRIYQQLGDSLVKAGDGGLFDLVRVKFEATEAKSNTKVKQGDMSELKPKSLIYTSDDLGSGNEIAIIYKPTDDFIKQKANFYTGTLNYYIELDRTTAALESGLIESLDLGFDVEPMFNIIGTSIYEDGTAAQEGVVSLQFDKISYKTGAKESRVRIKVESNLEKPYLVTQKISGPLENEEGYKIPDEFFTFRLEKEKDSGAKLKFDKETVIAPGKDVTLFVSNAEGDSDEFEIIYRLKVTGDTRGGSYNTGVSYSLSEL